MEHVSHRRYSTGFFFGQPGQYTESSRYIRDWQVCAIVTDCTQDGMATLSLRNKFAAGDLQGSLEAQFKLNPVRLAMDPASFPVAAKDMAALRGRDVGAPYRPSLPTPEGPAKEGFRRTMSEAGLI